MIMTNCSDLAAKCRSLRNLCFGTGKQRFVHEQLGWNYRMTNMQAALGLAQMESLDDHLKMKRRMGAIYNEALTGVPGLTLPVVETSYAQNLYWIYGIVVEDESSLDATELTDALAARGVGTRPFFWPIHEQPVLRRMNLFSGVSHPVAEKLSRQGFYLPSGLALTEDQIQGAASSVKEILTSTPSHSR